MSTAARRLSRALVTLALLLGLAPALGVAPAEAAACRPAALTTPARIGGIARVHRANTCAHRTLSGAAPAVAATIYQGGTPPLINSGGVVMGARTSSGSPQITLRPIFWTPPGYSFPAGYQTVIERYLRDVSADSGRFSNVFGTTTEYTGSNGAISYNFKFGGSILDPNGLPVVGGGCTANTGAIYADNSSYSACVDDAQIESEVASVAGSSVGLGALYLMFLPKGLESCFEADGDPNQACTTNSTPTSMYCGYHSWAPVGPSNALYANLPFPIYNSSIGQSCTDEGLDSNNLGAVQSPNGNADADVMLSTTSHEMAEAMTDPFLNTWTTVPDGFENGDLCAYDYGHLAGTSGHLYNQTINTRHYLTQTEFSNAAFLAGKYACLQQVPIPHAPVVGGVRTASGPTSGGRTITVTGTSLTGATRVTIGGNPAPFAVVSNTSLIAVTPARTTGTVDVRVTTPGGVSATGAADRYRYGVASVSSVSPTANSTTAGHIVTVSGTGFTGATKVLFGSTGARFSVTSDSRITAITPAHAQATVNVIVVNGAGSSATSAGTRYLFLSAPRVTRVSPTGGSHRGGTTVTITGSNFLRVRAVHFGYTAASFTVNSSTRITVRTPVHATGSVNVLVFTPGGASAVSAADRYRFT